MKLLIDIDMNDLISSAQVGDREELLAFIKDLDRRVGDWDFSLALYEHFAALKAEQEQEEAEDKIRYGR